MLLLLQVVFLRNYGVLVTGESIEEAFLTAANVVAAVDTQVTYWLFVTFKYLHLYLENV